MVEMENSWKFVSRAGVEEMYLIRWKGIQRRQGLLGCYQPLETRNFLIKCILLDIHLK